MSDREGEWAEHLGKAASKASREIDRLRAREAVFVAGLEFYRDQWEHSLGDMVPTEALCCDYGDTARKALATLDVPDPKEG